MAHASLVLDPRVILVEVDRRLSGTSVEQGMVLDAGQLIVSLAPASWNVLRLSSAPAA